MALGCRVVCHGESVIRGIVRPNTRRQALSCALDVALTRRPNSILRVDVRALAEASVHAVEGALHGHVHVLLVDLAVRASILGVAHAGSVVAPTGIAAVVGASLQTAVHTTKAGFAPAGTVEAKTVVCAVVDANGDLAVGSVPLRAANASTVVALSVGQSAGVSAQLNGAVKIGPREGAFASSVLALSVTCALIGAGRH